MWWIMQLRDLYLPLPATNTYRACGPGLSLFRDPYLPLSTARSCPIPRPIPTASAFRGTRFSGKTVVFRENRMPVSTSSSNPRPIPTANPAGLPVSRRGHGVRGGGRATPPSGWSRRVFVGPRPAGRRFRDPHLPPANAERLRYLLVGRPGNGSSLRVASCRRSGPCPRWLWSQARPAPTNGFARRCRLTAPCAPDIPPKKISI